MTKDRLHLENVLHDMQAQLELAKQVTDQSVYSISVTAAL